MSLFWQKRLILTLGIIAVSSAAILIRLCQQEIIEVTIAFSLFLAASRLIIANMVLIPSYGHLSTVNYYKQGIFYSLGAGICLACHFATWISSLNFTSVAASVSLVTTNPLWIALFLWWFGGQKISNRTFVGIIIAIMGSVFIAFAGGNTDFGSNPLLGAILALLGAWFASGYILLGKMAQDQGLSIQQYVIIAYLCGAVCLFPLPLLFGGSYLGYPSSVYIYVMLMAIVSQLIGHTSLNWCLRHFSPTTVSLLVLLEPVVSSLWAWWLFNEVPPVLVMIGAVILLAGVVISLEPFKTEVK